MTPPLPRSQKLTLLRGTLDIFVLRAVSRRPLHGFDIALWFERQTAPGLHVEDSALYQALHRLEARGDIEGKWGVSEKNRRARYYAITRRGRRHLAEGTDTLVSYAETITALLAPPRGAK
jgi:transcriptional regulator